MPRKKLAAPEPLRKVNVEARERFRRSPRGRLLGRIQLALGELRSLAAKDGLQWSDDMAAYALVQIGLTLLLNPQHRPSLEVVRQFDAFRQRRRLDSPETKLVELVRIVGMHAAVWALRDSKHFKADAAEARHYMRDDIIAVLGREHAERVPTAEAFAEMLTRHAESTRRGKITTIGIVADVLIATGALDVSPHEDRNNVVRLVDNAVRRAKPPIAGLFIPPPYDE